MVPDLDSFPDFGGYFTIKFTNNPVSTSGVYDKRLLNAVINPGPLPEEEEAAYKLARAAHERDPANNPKPVHPQCYNYFLSDTLETSDKFNQRFDALNPDHDDDSLYTSQNSDGHGCFQFRFVRTYETKEDVQLENPTKYDEELLIAINDDEMVDQKAVYYSPVVHRVVMKPQRSKTIHRNAGLADDQEEIPDRLAITVDDPDEKTRISMDKWKTDPYKDPFDNEELANGDDGAEKPEHHDEDDVNGNGEDEEASAPGRHDEDEDEDEDAEGDEEE
jgi:RNA polymerase II-associated factor 1